MSDHDANDAQASTGSHDDDSTTSSTSAANTPIGFYQRDAAVDILGPLLDERTRLIKEVVRTFTELNDMATKSSSAADPTYAARAVAHEHAKNEMSTNAALIRGNLESHRKCSEDPSRSNKSDDTGASGGT